jgi:subtilisin family serine protease
MHRSGVRLVFLLAFAVGSVGYGAEYAPGEILVKYKESMARSRTDVNTLYESIGVQTVHRFTHDKSDFEQLVLEQEDRVEDALARLRKNNTVEYAQPNYILRILPIKTNDPKQVQDSQSCCSLLELRRGDVRKPVHDLRPKIESISNEEIPFTNDPKLSHAYGITQVGAERAWSVHRGSKSVIVADLDTGIDYNHEDLSFNMWRNPHSTGDDTVGYDFVHRDGLPFDDNEHGTHTAGTIGAVGGNGVGISGVAQRVSLMALKFMSGEGEGMTSDAIRAIDYAIGHGAKILNNSWGSPGNPQDQENLLLREAFIRARDKGVLVITAAGNDGQNNDGDLADYPAAFNLENQISVAATDSEDNLAEFSNYGKQTTHLAAPGVDIYSTKPGNKYQAMSGSSMACPHVAGAAALLWAKHPNWNYKQIKSALLDSVDRFPALQDKVATGGRLNIYRAMGGEE